MNKKVVFMGSPDFALPILRALSTQYHIVGVVTQPDQPVGRGLTFTPPPVKLLAQELGIPTIQPLRMKDPETMVQLQAWEPELIVVAAFGKILRANVLDFPPYGCINVHASLLPRWRGAAPIQATILHGDVQTGITIMMMDPGIDTGPILSQRTTQVESDETPETLSPKLAKIGAILLIETLLKYLNGELVPLPQDDTKATYAPMLKKEDGLLDFTQPAVELARRVRAFYSWPGAFTIWENNNLKIHRAHAIDTVSPGPGIHGVQDRFPAIGTSQGLLVLDQVQLAGKKAMPGDVFLRGVRNWL
ncbi:MAG: methionyl-tRNA formyltransferase [Anaerolineales bacterium]|nr:methionyl-tRNA formyltransferase [Anaerolineales bacterium]